MPSRLTTNTNFLIQSMSKTQRERFLKLCSVEQLSFGTIICEANQPYKYIYFPLSSFFSLIAKVAEHPPLEMGLIGNEGMLGSSVVLGVNLAPMQSIVQGTGATLKISVSDFKVELHSHLRTITLFNRYIYTLIQQLAQSGLCIHYHNIESRLARWLLMTHDRAQRDSFFLTHSFLAHMLGVRRSGVSLAAGKLKDRNLISYSRGEITILNRKGLEETSCECYQIMNKVYARILSVK